MKRFLALILFGPLLAGEAADLPSQWKNVQTLEITKTGLIQFSVPLDTLTAARPDLEDLRLFDQQGRETPFVLETPGPRQAASRAVKNFAVRVDSDRTVVVIETGVTQALSGVTLVTPARDFLKPVQIEVSKNQIEWLNAGQGQPIFHQPNGASKLQLRLPSGVWPFVRLILDDRRSPPIPVTGAVVQTESAGSAAAEPLELKIVQRNEEPGQTRFALQLGGAHFTLARLTIETPEPLFARPVTIAQQRYVDNELRESIIFRDSIYRVPVEGQSPLSKVSLAAEVPSRSRDLFLTIENQDNPPMSITRIQAERRPVYLTFFSGQTGPYHLLTGNPHCSAPRYELGSLRENLESASIIAVSPSALTTNALYQAGQALPQIETLGAPIDTSPWKFRKRIELGPGSVQQLDLDLELRAHATSSLGDLRVVRDGRQIPYLLERQLVSRSLVPAFASQVDSKRPTLSRWHITLPFAALPITRITATIATPYFQRDVRLYENRSDETGNSDRLDLGSAVWVRTLGSKAAPLTLQLVETPATDKLILEIENGDNPPLSLQKIEAWHPVTRLVFKAPANNSTFVYYGNARASFPRYDLELVVPTLLAAEKGEARLASEEVLKPGRRDQFLAGSAGWIFWLILGLVVVFLLFVIARLLPPSSPEPPA